MYKDRLIVGDLQRSSSIQIYTLSIIYHAALRNNAIWGISCDTCAPSQRLHTTCTMHLPTCTHVPYAFNTSIALMQYLSVAPHHPLLLLSAPGPLRPGALQP